MKLILNNFWSSRPFRLSLSILMLTISVLLLADTLNFRDNKSEWLGESRKVMSEALALQLSTFASISDQRQIRRAVEDFVKRNKTVDSAKLVSISDGTIARFGASEAADSSGFLSTITPRRLVVPIYQDNARWGEVEVYFKFESTIISTLAYFSFVIICCFAIYYLFLNRALAQLNPSQVVPGRVNTAFDMLSDGVVILDESLRIVMANRSLLSSANKRIDDIIGQKLDSWNWITQDDEQLPWNQAFESRVELINRPLKVLLPDGMEHLFMVSCAPIGETDNGPTGLLVTLDDMTAIENKNRELASTLKELRQSQTKINLKNEELQKLAAQDPLTGLANRRALMDRADQEYAKAKREVRELSVLMVDIDHFKSINDKFGHSIGDEVIKAVANVLQTTCREYDVVGRYGGEEFVVLLPEVTSEIAIELGNRLRVAIEQLVNAKHLPMEKLSASFGAATYSEDTESMAHLLDCADQALYVAKESGRNRVIAYDKNVIRLHQKEMKSREEELLESEQALSLGHEYDEAILSHEQRLAELEQLVEERTQELDRANRFDNLTGIPMRAVFLERIDSEISRSVRDESLFSVLSVEINSLDRIISTYGHAMANETIKATVQKLREILRQSDMVTSILDEHNLSLITQNEFGVLVTGLSGNQDILRVISRIKRAFADSLSVCGNNIYAGLNIGIANFPDNGQETEALLDAVSTARHQAAESNENISHSFASEAENETAREYFRIESELVLALSQGQLEVHYQPMIDTETQTISAIEALTRWNHPTLGYISPTTFIGIAESNGLINQLSEYVVTRAIQDLQHINEKLSAKICLSVNISPTQVRNSQAVEYILQEISDQRLPAELLQIELTETAIMSSPEIAKNVLNRFREHGVGISIDDFGTGHSSLSILATLPIDKLKIDRSFVSRMSNGAKDITIIETIVRMAHTLNIKVVAEGVEEFGQLTELEKLHCDEIQGFYYSPALPLGDLIRYAEDFSSQQHQSAS